MFLVIKIKNKFKDKFIKNEDNIDKKYDNHWEMYW